MAQFYGQVRGMSDTTASRRGGRDIRVSAQSWNGSLITIMHYNGDELMVELQMNDGSEFSGVTVFYGTFEELRAKLLS